MLKTFLIVLVCFKKLDFGTGFELGHTESKVLAREFVKNSSKNMVYLGQFGSKAWYAFDEQVTQSEARIKCQNLSMNLGIVDSQAEQEFLASKTNNHLYHLDGNLFARPQSFRWSSGLRELNIDLPIAAGNYGLRLDTITQQLISPGRSGAKGNFLCFSSRITVEYPNRNHSEVYTQQRLEEKNITLQPLHTFQFLGQFGPKAFYYNDSLVNWNEAKQSCLVMRMEFVRFDSPVELQWVASGLEHLGAAPSQTVWTDGEIKPGSIPWTWIGNGNILNSDIHVADHGWGLGLQYKQLRAHAKQIVNHKFPFVCFVYHDI